MWSLFWLGDKFVKYTIPISAKLYFLNHSIDLLSGETHKEGITSLIKRIDKTQLNQEIEKYICHFYYECGLILNEIEFLNPEIPLAIEVQYSEVEDWRPLREVPSLEMTEVSGVSIEEYAKAFDKGHEHLLRGDCYQFNLTYPFKFKWQNNLKPLEICSRLWEDVGSIAPYAHATYIPFLDTLYLSNSPECLFQMKKRSQSFDIWTMPIKGTLPRGTNWKDAWRELRSSRKDRGELDMITDLLRNDLSRIEEQVSRVIKRRSPLLVPGIIHQYSLIKSTLSLSVSLGRVMRSMFPGGSITGAPKKNSIKILKNLESSPRGFYCGSTVIIDKSIIAASVNIRSACIELDKKQLEYHAGGGVTLLSHCHDEYSEMLLKKKSFVRNL
ncbi:hypothetical protein A9Q84_08555 [Halobacteriovorax marinus]|uniref:Chorismate-utilising enzyme C-terminal domain-containing protein n=1 Tax=Halobacteriovorax marinus TaxID=97084 RepID=A0A1Y5FCN2_9BACT|nr:hypothetical protein A9Q84_08555 [Halobacteriovorax marinus]